MITVVLGIGSNCGDRVRNVEKAMDWLSTVLAVEEHSAIYETPCAKKIGRPYMNAVVSGKFEGTSDELDLILKNYEKEEGRDKRCRERGDVPIDIDIVIAEETIIKEWDYRQKFFQIGFSEINILMPDNIGKDL